MNSTTFDSLDAYEMLKEQGKFSEENAKAISHIFKALQQALEVHHAKELASKRDLWQLMAELKVELIKWMLGIMIAQVALIVGLLKFS